MRLTLRTLLAYLDDVLEPNAAREIGAKLGESPVAASLVERIKDVLKRRRIGTPDVTGPGSKPNANLVAEYLDNTLVGNDVEEIERICLDSDVHLAEVAACHKILTLVLGEPVEVARSTRERMYALGAVMPSEQASGKSVAAPVSQNGSEQVLNLSQPTVLPKELARSRSQAPLWIGALVLIVFGAWIGLVINDHGLLDFLGSGDADSALAVNDDGNGAPDSAADEAFDDDAGADGAGAEGDNLEVDANGDIELPSNMGVAESATTLTDEQINPPPPDDLSADGTTDEVEMDGDGESAVVVTDVPVIDSQETVIAEPGILEEPADIVVVSPGDEESPAVVSGSGVQVLYDSHEDVLLHLNQLADPPGWFVLARNSVIRDGQSIACPEPFEAQLLVSGAMCRIDLIGGTRLRSVGSIAANGFEFELERGGIVIRHTGGPDDPSANCGLRVAGELMQFKLFPGAILGVQVDRLPPTGRETDTVLVPMTMLTAFIPQGHCVLTAANGVALDLAPEVNGLVTWHSQTGLFVPQNLQAPDWYAALIGERTRAAQQTATRYEEMFLIDQPIESTIPTIVRHDEPRFVEFAVETLGLIGDYAQLARALDSDKETAILAAGREISIWLPLDPENGARLHDELERNVREMSDVDILEVLLWGYDTADAQRTNVSETLVEWLLHDNLAVRLLAFEQIRRFTGVTQNYQPNAPLRHREISTDNWREHLRRNGGALIAP